MSRESKRVFQRLVQQWGEVSLSLAKLAQGCTVRPSDGWEVLRLAEDVDPENHRFELQPVVFNLPERGNSAKRILYVVAKGWLEISKEPYVQDKQLVTHAFGTQIAYFRRAGDSLQHVYGAHYDAAFDELGHPTFHAQLRNFPELASAIHEQFGLEMEVCDYIQPLLRNVRLPTAQMDFFSVIIQLFADHLIDTGSSRNELEAFNSMLDRSEFLMGAAKRSSRLTEGISPQCYRACHWYPLVT